MSTITPIRNPRITIDRIAIEANVGRTTVADIVNRGAGHKYKSSTRNRVLEAAKRLGYVPSSVAQTIARGRSGQVGLMLTRDFRDPYWARVTAEVESRLRTRGLFLQLAITDGNPAREAELIRYLHGLHIEGLIVGPVYEDQQVESHQQVFQRSIPIVAFGGPIRGFDNVGIDHGLGRRLAVEHLLTLGHRRIGYLCLPDRGGIYGDGLNIAAFRQTLEERGLFDPAWIFPQWVGLPVEQHAQLIREFLLRWRQTPVEQRPTAMICHDDLIAQIALSVFYREGLRVPADLSLVGFNNLPETTLTTPALTTLDAHVDCQMEHALRLLLDEPQAIDIPPRSQLITPTLVIRESTRPLEDHTR